MCNLETENRASGGSAFRRPDGGKRFNFHDRNGYTVYGSGEVMQLAQRFEIENRTLEGGQRNNSHPYPSAVYNRNSNFENFSNQHQQISYNGSRQDYQLTYQQRMPGNSYEVRNDISLLDGARSWPGATFVQPSYRRHFEPHLPIEIMNDAVEKGKAFKAKFRVNMHNRDEAYCTVEGVPIDILISGKTAQNRAVEGDIVAIVLDSVSSWPDLKGFDSKKKADEFFETGDLLLQSSSSDEEDNLTPGSSACVSSSISFREHYSLHYNEKDEMSIALSTIILNVKSHPDKRPTGRVIGILEKSRFRDTVIGFFEITQWLGRLQSPARNRKNKVANYLQGHIKLVPTNAKLPKMIVIANSLPEQLKQRLMKNDKTLENELFAASIDLWAEENVLPLAVVRHSLGEANNIEVQIAAVLLEHAVPGNDFSQKCLSCLPRFPWTIPDQEVKARRDLRGLRIFTIDPPTANDLDDALSIEILGDDLLRIGVHIADVSYFVKPNTMLDNEARNRGTAFYLVQQMFPMLPRVLCDELCSLNPGVDRLAFSVMWDMAFDGQIINHWIGRTIIRSCCKLSYEHVQDMIDGNFDCSKDAGGRSDLPQLYGMFKWQDIIQDVLNLHGIAKHRKAIRFCEGALKLDNSKLTFILDKDGMPCDMKIYEHKESNSIVEEFMLLANTTVAEVITRAFPQCSLLRRHPEPNARKMRELQRFCRKHGLGIDVSCAAALQTSLQKLKEDLKNDPELFDIIVMYATKPMQLAEYCCSGEFVDNETEWAHYALATPIYTHFTSPIRRYPDIIVHRILAAALEADEICQKMLHTEYRCFTGLVFEEQITQSSVGKKALLTATLKNKVLPTASVALIAAHCNDRKLASKGVREATEKIYLWSLLNKRKLITHAKVLGLGSKFMSVYIPKLAMERRIYFDAMEGLVVQWYEITGTLVLDFYSGEASKTLRKPRDESPTGSTMIENHINDTMENLQDAFAGFTIGDKGNNDNATVGEDVEPAFLPMTVKMLSTVPVVVDANRSRSGAQDFFSVQLFLSSYLGVTRFNCNLY